MNRPLTALFTALFSALEAILVVAIGIAIPLVPLTVLWAFQYGLQIDWVVFWRAATDLWLLGSGVDVRMTLDPALATSLKFPGAAAPFVLSIAPLGFALLTLLLGVRAGRRIGETPHRIIGVATAILTFLVAALVVTLTATISAAEPSLWQGLTLPTLVFAIGIVVGAEIGRAGSSRLTGHLASLNPRYAAIAATALRGGTAAVALILALSAVIVALLLLGNYASIIGLYEHVHAGILGGFALTVGQIALLPNVVVWVASWLIGPGFALGSGSSISALGTIIGPIPAIPIFGALPQAGTLDWGFIGLLVPVLAGFVTAVVLRAGLVRSLGGDATIRWLALTGLLSGIVGGLILGLLAWASGGSAGPGRLLDVGPSALLVGLYAALEIALSVTIGLLVARPVASGRRWLSWRAGERGIADDRSGQTGAASDPTDQSASR